MAEIKQTTNVVNVVGVLVKNGLECKVNSKGADYIGGSLVLRTNDGSEHQIDYYANKGNIWILLGEIIKSDLFIIISCNPNLLKKNTNNVLTA